MKVKVIIISVILILFLLIILQNTQPVTFTLFIWDITLPLILMLSTLFIAGLILGMLWNSFSQRKKNSAKQQKSIS